MHLLCPIRFLSRKQSVPQGKPSTYALQPSMRPEPQHDFYSTGEHPVYGREIPTEHLVHRKSQPMHSQCSRHCTRSAETYALTRTKQPPSLRFGYCRPPHTTHCPHQAPRTINIRKNGRFRPTIVIFAPLQRYFLNPLILNQLRIAKVINMVLINKIRVLCGELWGISLSLKPDYNKVYKRCASPVT